VGKVSVDDAAGEVGAMVGGAIEVIFVGRIVKFLDQLAVLFY
jgi:hypothetical protein